MDGLEVGRGLSPADAAAVRDLLHAFNAEVTGFTDGEGLSAAVRGADGRLLAGVDGFTWGGYARLEYVWVAPESRGRGLGTAMVRAVLAEARARGCSTVVVDSHTFQAPDFYRRLGFVEVGRTSGTPRGYDQVLLQFDLGGQ